MGQLFFKGFVLAIALLVTGIAVFNEGETTVMRFEPSGDSVATTSITKSLEVVVDTQKAINAVSGTIVYPVDALEVQLVKDEVSDINLWAVEPNNNKKTGTITFAGGVSNKEGITKKAILFALDVTLISTTSTELILKDVEAFAADGRGTAVPIGIRSYTLNPPTSNTSIQSTGNEFSAQPSLRDRADLNNDGIVSLTDLSILMIKSVDKYDSKYDFNNDGKLDLGDISTFVTVLGK